MRLLLLFLFLPLLSSAQDFIVRGFLFDAKNGEAVSNVKVSLLTPDSTLIAEARTNENGLFSIPKLTKASYILEVIPDRYKPVRMPVTLTGEKKL